MSGYHYGCLQLAVVFLASLSPSCFASDGWTVDVNARVRLESRERTTTLNRAVSSVTDDTWWLSRVRLGLKGEPFPRWAAHVQLQDSRQYGSDRGSVPFITTSDGDDPLDLRQAYLESKTAAATWRIGRQVLALGDERLLGPSEWSNFGRSFDAARVTLPRVGAGLDVFVASIVQIQPGAREGWHANHSSSHDLFAGAYSRFAPAADFAFEPYLFLRRSDHDLVYSSPAGTSRPYDIPQKIATLGAKFAGPLGHPTLRFDADAVAQAGEARARQRVGNAFAYPGPAWLEHRAWAAHAGIAWTPSIGSHPVRLYLEANRASGDRDPADGRTESFLNLFPSNHKLYGTMDVIAWKNMREVAVHASTKLGSVTARLEHHWFALDRTTDAWFRSSSSAQIRTFTAGTRTAPRRAGRETDATLSLPLGPHVTLELGGGHFAAGPYLHRTGGGSDAWFAYLQPTLQW